jgi:hypothetical protein
MTCVLTLLQTQLCKFPLVLLQGNVGLYMHKINYRIIIIIIIIIIDFIPVMTQQLHDKLQRQHKYDDR